MTQPVPDAVDVAFDATRANARDVLSNVDYLLNLRADLRGFESSVATIPWLRDFALTMRGVKPARYLTVWEAAANAIVFQSVSMLAAGAVIERFVAAFGTHAQYGRTQLDVFPAAQTLAAVTDSDVRSIGLSGAKANALRGLAHAVLAGGLEPAALDALATAALCERLQRIGGIGPWSAAVIALRALGRLDAFPPGDSGVERTIVAMGGPPGALPQVLTRLGDFRGMFYHLLLLWRLAARGKLPAARFPES